MAAIRIQPASEQDAPIVLEMIRAFGENPAADVLLAYQGEECVGFAVFFATYSTFLAQPGVYLEDIFVKPHARGQGAGLALLKRVAAIAHERDCGRVEWEVLDWNQPSIEFYKKLGATPVDGWTKYRLTGEALEQLAATPADSR
jgi:GNAT superfamily N-acetyltransferase